MNIQIDNIIRSKRKTISLEITSDAKIVIKAPHYVSINYLEDFIIRKKDWIIKKVNIIKERNQLKSKRIFSDKGKILFLGKDFDINFNHNSKRITLGEKLLIPIKYKCDTKKYVINWYKKQARIILNKKVFEIAQKFGFNYRSIRISDAKTRWGSCSGKNNLNFSWRIIMAPIQIIDYIIIHELIHTEIKNHSREYWNKVVSICPNCKNYRKWLKENGHLLDL
ncbi:MAG: M48 family metallopeptidase [Ignavibacteriales bacterium]|nr:M48 family metallopeptidase [Ignavibacteriales bacterium]